MSKTYQNTYEEEEEEYEYENEQLEDLDEDEEVEELDGSAAQESQYVVQQVVQDVIKGKRPRLGNDHVLEKLGRMIETLANEMKNMSIIYKDVRKEYLRIRKKVIRKEAMADKPKQPRGFQQPVLVSNELCDLLGLQKGVPMTRNAVVSLLRAYIKEHKLEDPKDRRHIIANADLEAIFDLQPGEVPTYFNIQTFVKHHFLKYQGTPPEVSV